MLRQNLVMNRRRRLAAFCLTTVVFCDVDNWQSVCTISSMHVAIAQVGSHWYTGVLKDTFLPLTKLMNLFSEFQTCYGIRVSIRISIWCNAVHLFYLLVLSITVRKKVVLVTVFREQIAADPSMSVG